MPPQPLAQSRNWLSCNLPDVEQIPASSTAQAAELAKRDKNSAAIAGQLAAEVHQLKIIAKNIQDRAENHTRLIVVQASTLDFNIPEKALPLPARPFFMGA